MNQNDYDVITNSENEVLYNDIACRNIEARRMQKPFSLFPFFKFVCEKEIVCIAVYVK